MIKVLEGKSIFSVDDFHLEIKSILGFPDYYGKNLDALWDCLSECTVPVTLIWNDFEISKMRLGEFADNALLVFKDVSEEFPDFKLEHR